MTPILSLRDVEKTFGGSRRGAPAVKAVAGVSLDVGPGETLGIVGESGCGKSTLARIALRLIDPTSGSVVFEGTDVTSATPRALLPVRRRMQAVFQDPLASFNARMSIREILREPFETHGLQPPGGLSARISELLDAVGLSGIDPGRLPGQFSGGQLQRIAIARALALDPDVIVADEPTSALDPSIQAQIINLFLQIRRQRGIALFIISHDLDVIGHVADRIAVMYLGGVVEEGPASSLLSAPLHPYTQALLSAAPTLAARRSRTWRRVILSGDPPNPAQAPSGCRFHPRCPLARERCRVEAPPLAVLEGGHGVACHFAPGETRETGARIARARRGDLAA